MAAGDNKAVVQRWVDGWNRQDVGIVDALVAPAFVRHGNDAPEVRGPDAERELMRGYLAAFPDLHFTIEDLVAEGDRVVGRYTARGTQRGALAGLPPSNRTGEIAVIEIYRLVGGQLAEQWVVADMLGLMQQLGAVPAPRDQGSAGQ